MGLVWCNVTLEPSQWELFCVIVTMVNGSCSDSTVLFFEHVGKAVTIGFGAYLAASEAF